MTRLTFAVSASSFAVNMAVKQNDINFAKEYPKAASIVPISFYVDAGLTGEDLDEKARKLQNQLQALFARAGFLLRKWMSSEPDVLRHLEPHLLEKQPYQDITELHAFTKVLGIEWDSQSDTFCLAIGSIHHDAYQGNIGFGDSKNL